MTIPYYTLRNGDQVPQVGLGTYKLKGRAGVDSIKAALDIGYRYLDTAYNYENEGTVGQAIRESGLARDQIQVASKLPGRYHTYDLALTAIEESLYRAQLDYYDYYLIHWPNPKQGHYVEAWQALIEAQKRGYVKAIGVSNFLPEHIDRLIEETQEVPVMNQVETHPYFQQAKQIAYDRGHDILTQAWSPLGRGSEKMSESILEQDPIKEIAKKHDKTPGQVVLRWHLQIGTMPIPKSSHAVRLEENFRVFDFELDDSDMAQIARLDHPNGRTGAQNPAVYEEF